MTFIPGQEAICRDPRPFAYYLLIMKIQILSPEVIDQIAAGEVVERPSHMIKELVENSLDAGADRIEVDFDFGGRSVSIKDNGRGMSADQLPIALARHATSKITQADDLWHLHSFGFRGEALASISAVSRLELISREPQKDEAFKLVSEFGKVSPVTPSAGVVGTSLVLERLFENIPARLKFLKSEAAESTQIKIVLKALALAHPQVDFLIKQKSKLIFSWPKTTPLQRIQQLLEVDELYETFHSEGGKTVRAYFAPPHIVSKSSRQLWFFVQNRWVQDRTLLAATHDAFHNLLMHGEFPIAALFLTLPDGEVDVNIHPTKSQVKFRDNSETFRLVRRALRDGLEKAPWIPAASQSLLTKEPATSTSAPVYEAENLRFDDTALQKTQYAQKRFFHERVPPGLVQNYLGLDKSPPLANGEGTQTIPINERERNESPSVAAETAPYSVELSFEATGEIKGYWSSLQVLGQANLTYILTQKRQGLVLVDQHAAHERILFERLYKNWKEGKAEVQALLLPLSIRLPEHQIECILQLTQDLSHLGFELEQSGPEHLEVMAHPVGIQEKAIEKALVQFAEEIAVAGGSLKIEKLVTDLCATMACHSAVRAGQNLTTEQMRALLEQMDEFPLSSFCPHGRPVSVDYSFYELEKDFGRIV